MSQISEQIWKDTIIDHLLGHVTSL